MKSTIALALIIALATSSHSLAADKPERSTFSMGLQLAPLTFGLSLKYASSERWKWQAVVSPDGTDDTAFTLRTLRTARQAEYWNSYVFAGVARGRSTFSFYNEESTIVSGGLGVEWSRRARNSNFPPLYASVEFGLGYESTDIDGDNSNSNNNNDFDEDDGVILVLGLGLHYQF